MPDWSYRTVTQRILFGMRGEQARDFALGLMGRLSRTPFGPTAIDLLGHMRADPRLGTTLLGIQFPGTVGLGPGLDGRAVALTALARFGFGFVEVGPVTAEGGAGGTPVERLDAEAAFRLGEPPSGIACAGLGDELARVEVPTIVRLGCVAGTAPEEATAGCLACVGALGPHAALFSLDTLWLAVRAGWSTAHWRAHVESVIEGARGAGRPLLICLRADAGVECDALVDQAVRAGVAGLVIDGSIADGESARLLGLPARSAALAQVSRVRARWGDTLAIVAGGGVHEPMHALEMKAAGADLVQLDTGLVFSGPGLPKRVNEALLYEVTRGAASTAPRLRWAEASWFWMALMGCGMLLGSLMALAIAATRVVLPYDEAFVGMTRVQLAAVNPRLLDFMAHDRVCLAGTMVCVGVMYVGFALGGVRRGAHWAQMAVFASALTGFACFFSFLGFGYFDPFHAFVTSILMQFLVMAAHCRLDVHVPHAAPELVETAAWRRAQWGQLLLIMHGTALLVAGLVITLVGMTRVFVPEDLEFMHCTAEALVNANPRLLPLVAHDRATFGGMLLASGWLYLLSALWGFRNGSAWLWWTSLIGGLAAYAAAIGVHLAVGYTSAKHLAPAFGGLLLLVIGLALSHAHLTDRGREG